MKFRVRFADKIVGVFIIIALASVAFLIIMLGRSQRWFSRDVHFRTEFVSANGLSRNMPVLYKGFTIGNVISFRLNDFDQVEAIFTIFEEYLDRVKEGSIVELIVSPIGLGNQFHFYAGRGDALLEDGDFIPRAGSSMAQNFISHNMADVPSNDDSISVLISRVNSLVAELDEALGAGTDSTEIGQIVRSLRHTVAGVETLPDTINRTVDDVMVNVDELVAMVDGALTMVNGVLAAVNPVISDINTITSMAADPDGTVAALLGTDGDIYVGLTRSLDSLAGIIEELEKTAAFIPRQLPQIAGLITDLRTALITAEDVLVALTNNPLLRNGIPERVDVQSSGTSPRDIRF
ncbi:MAG: MlaD family protein [Treponema sp.]|jgi:phospholipid/cholesterol/gamma-HCH transport system substrate-binding protein|nr:MlaD family protein [Treponema sp.]